MPRSRRSGAGPAHVLADRLRIYRRDARRRLEEAIDLAGRRALSGAPLAPKLQATAAGQAAGDIGVEQVAIIREFLAQLPCWVDEATRGEAEATLAESPRAIAPMSSNASPTGMPRCSTPTATSPMSTAPADAGSSSAASKRRHVGDHGLAGPRAAGRPGRRPGEVAAPGMCNPQDEMPTIAGEPSPEAIEGDDRSAAQRTHDALNAMVRTTLMSGELGSHQGLPVTITATVELNGSAGQGRDGPHRGRHPAAGPHPDPDGRPRLQLLADLRQGQAAASCTRAAAPGWPPPPNAWCSTHSSAAAPNPAATPRPTGAKCITPPRTGPPAVKPTSMTSPCRAGPQPPVTDGGWTTKKREDGTTEWIPPPRPRPRPTPHQHLPPPRKDARTTTKTKSRTNACDCRPAHPPTRSPRARPPAPSATPRAG